MTDRSREKPKTYTLAVVTGPDQWQRYHFIRSVELFEGRHGHATYDPDHPDERPADHYSLLLTWNGVGIATTRLDLLGNGAAAIRLVAVIKAEQGKGHGRALQTLVEDFARGKGVARLVVNAAPEALGFYERMGFTKDDWNPAELIGIASDCVQMTKTLT